MKIKILFLAVLLAAAPAAAQTGAAQNKPNLSTYNYVDASGRSVQLGSRPGQYTVLHFWATWCVPCVRELPTLNALAKRLQTTPPGTWRVVAVALDETPAVVSAFFKRHRITALDANIDPAMNAMRMARVAGLPTTLIVDDKGAELRRYVGDHDWTTFNTDTLDVKPAPDLY